jgi:hypothetical protein
MIDVYEEVFCFCIEGGSCQQGIGELAEAVNQRSRDFFFWGSG